MGIAVLSVLSQEELCQAKTLGWRSSMPDAKCFAVIRHCPQGIKIVLSQDF
jgi:hypothetical protein